MTKRIKMNNGASVNGGIGVGVMTSAGNPWTVADSLADELVNRSLATYVDQQTSTSVSGGAMRLVGANKVASMLDSIGRAAYQREYWLLHSHSIGAGAWVNDTPPGNTADAAYTALTRTQSWPAITARALSSFVGGVGLSAGEPMCGINANTANLLFTPGGGAAMAVAGLVGPGGWWATVSQPARTLAFKAVGPVLKVWALSDFAGRQARYTLNGGATQDVTGVASAVNYPGSTNVWYEYTISGLTAGDDVVLVGPAAGTAIPYFIDLDYRPTTPGLSIYRLCCSGQSLRTLHASCLNDTDIGGLNGAWQGAGAANTRLGQSQSMSARYGASGVILQTDVNDIYTASLYGITLDDHKRHLSNYLAYHLTLGLPVVVNLGPKSDPALLPAGSPYGQEQIVAAYKEVIAAAPNAAYVDWIAPYRGTTDAATYASNQAVLADVVHPHKSGHAHYGLAQANAFLAAMAAVMR